MPPTTPGRRPSTDADLVLNATPVRDELLVDLGGVRQVVDLAYQPDGGDTALIAAARAAGCERVVDGLDVLVGTGRGVVRALDGNAGAGRGDERRSS